MQYLIIKQFKQYLFDVNRPKNKELLYAFENNMADAINKIYTRMNRPNYKNNWIFSSPKKKLENCTKDNWHPALCELVHTTLLPTSETNNEDENIDLSSDEEQKDPLEPPQANETHPNLQPC